jgi:hypothetical protein
MCGTFTVQDVKGWEGKAVLRESRRTDGYRGIWYALGFKFEYGDKYSGGLGTYTANHQPMAVHVPAVNRTYFTYGGTPDPGRRELAIMVSEYDHATGGVPRPVCLYFDPAVDDPHDNAALQVDPDGHIWIFKSGRGIARPGLVFRSARPYSLDAFELVDVQEFTYPQIRNDGRGGFFLLFTKYTFQPGRGPARKLFWKTSADRRTWSEDRPLACFEGHYQTSGQCGDLIATFFNWHPGSDVDKRTNLYYAQTRDWGKTWTRADGTPLALPLEKPGNAALVLDLQAEGKCMYTCDLNFDRHGRPILLFLTSRKGEPGPAGDPREWTLMHWDGSAWRTRVIAVSDHNYDMGSLYVDGDTWRVIGPTDPGPQRYGTGGEMALWTSTDEGRTWAREARITQASRFNHSYARRPDRAADPFFAFWADGNPQALGESRLFFCDSSGKRVRELPYAMEGESFRW